MNEIVEITYPIKAKTRDVFMAIVDKTKLQGYFVSSANMDLKAGAIIEWEWSDYNAKCDIKVLELIEDEKILFEWPAHGDNKTVCIKLRTLENGQTEINITESSFGISAEEIKKIKQQTQGWTDFVCSLKAYLYTGVNLRNGVHSN